MRNTKTFTEFEGGRIVEAQIQILFSASSIVISNIVKLQFQIPQKKKNEGYETSISSVRLKKISSALIRIIRQVVRQEPD